MTSENPSFLPFSLVSEACSCNFRLQKWLLKKGKKKGGGGFGFFSCLTPGPPQRDFPSAAAFEVDLSWLVDFVLL